jgi:hypothetical protein
MLHNKPVPKMETKGITSRECEPDLQDIESATHVSFGQMEEGVFSIRGNLETRHNGSVTSYRDGHIESVNFSFSMTVTKRFSTSGIGKGLNRKRVQRD